MPRSVRIFRRNKRVGIGLVSSVCMCEHVSAHSITQEQNKIVPSNLTHSLTLTPAYRISVFSRRKLRRWAWSGLYGS